MLQDALYALRTFRQNPGFTAVVVVSIALAIAANTTIFSIANGLLWGELPVREPARLVGLSSGSMSYPDYSDYRDQGKSVFEGVSAHFPALPASIGGRREPERVWGQAVSGNYFEVVGVTMAHGRPITPAEDVAAGRDRVVVLSHALWQRRFGADPGLIGQTIPLNGMPYVVIGVTPRGFRGTDRGIVPEFWAPLVNCIELMPDLALGAKMDNRRNSWVRVSARLKPGVSREQAAAAVTVIKNRIDDTYFAGDQGRRQRPMTVVKAGTLIDGMERAASGLMAVLMVVVGGLLLIACANVANILLARATARQKEVAIRLSVGAERGRLVRQMLTESVLLASMGAAAGFALAFWVARLISAYELPLPLPIVFDFTPDLRVLGFTALLTVATGVLFGLAPALKATRPDLVGALKNEITTFGGKRRIGLRDALVVVQVALSLVLLTGSGLCVRSLQNASSIDIGMKGDNVLVLAVDPKVHGYTPEKTRQLVSNLRERVSAIPGVRSVSFLDSLPLSLGGTDSDLSIQTAKDGERRVNAHIYHVGERFFETMQLRLKSGRDFDLRRDGAATAIINETLAEKLFGAEDPLGRPVSQGKERYTVVGVCGNSKSRILSEAPAAVAYFFLEPKPDVAMSFFGISIAVKTAGNPRAMERMVRNEISSMDPTLAIFNVKTMQEHFGQALLIPRLCAVLLAVFGGVGLTLAGIGLYGVISYSARRRTREFGIRMALGSGRGGVVGLVLRHGLAVAGFGIAAGLGLSLAVTRFVASLLYGISATDTLTFVVVPAVLLAIALAAVVAPALRAARIAPMNALRYE
jgi:predicted permease